MAPPIELRHGYNLADLDRMARKAVSYAGPMAMDYQDRYDEALSFIGLTLYTSDTPIADRELVHAGRDAVWALMADVRHHHGYYRNNATQTWGEVFSGPRFRIYWRAVAGTSTPAEERVVERLTLAQILPFLTPRQREAVAALAAFDDHAPAANALGMSESLFSKTLSNARRRFLALWHEGEVPSRPWGYDTRGARRNATEIIRKRREVTRG